jgi:prepilin-type processing-associated H-X9-DG protein
VSGSFTERGDCEEKHGSRFHIERAARGERDPRYFGRGNVLYMDGHVSFEKYPGDFPMSPNFAQIAEIGA